MGYPDPILCEPGNLGRTQNLCNATGTSNTDQCSKLYVDIGANTGQSVGFWYHNQDGGRGCREFALAYKWKERRLFCADVFEAEPSQTPSLRREVARHQARGRHVRLYDSTPFSLNGGDMIFNSIGKVNNAGGTLAAPESSSTNPPLADGGDSKRMVLHSMNGINYLRNLNVTHLVLKIGPLHSHESKHSSLQHATMRFGLANGTLMHRDVCVRAPCPCRC